MILVGGLLALLVVVLLGLYLGSQHAPAFYREALEADPIEQEQASDRMLQQSMALASALKKEGHWEAVFTAEEINGWLAVDMVKNHPGTVAPPLSDPRVAIDANAITVACTIEQEGRSSVISLSVEPFMSEPNVLALRIVKARAGMLPLPLGEILDRISQAAHSAQLHIEWRQSGGNPVALLTLPVAQESDGRRVRIEILRLEDDEIYIAGSTQ